MSRCRNCGILAHKTQNCPRYGPWYPEPGKTREDYAELASRIVTLVAGDILAEHEGHEHEPDYVTPVSRGGRPQKVRVFTEQETEALTRYCTTCLAPAGQHCTTSAGRQAEKLHRARFARREDEHGHVQSAEPAAP